MLGTRHKGSLTWADLGTPDLPAASSFYASVLGWRADEGDEDFGGYVTYRSEGDAVAGGMTVPESQDAPAWTVYFRTPDVDATAKAVEEAGGTVAMEPMDVGELGRMTVCADPAGAGFGLWQAGTMQGFDAFGRTGACCWAELFTPDIEGATAFYGSVLGIQTFDVSYPTGSYTTLHPAEAGVDAMFGGVVEQSTDASEADGPAHWLPYFAVADCDAAAAAAGGGGGTVRVDPLDVPDVGRLARFADPFGARFAVLKPKPRQGDAE
ncbi:VOC family protein [Streptomyces sp. B-S-A8]|uniref:VOC family protein n=1 Tax=Streptomyces solicavernae TaxID=3043614 RepID=A0ABT6RNV9_9ACTN|nr:VOC family protein [Streptomyces sp. B-S-A8]MDI3385391.1 VOC family protein [Streptomyces sp. B-S-A8]